MLDVIHNEPVPVKCDWFFYWDDSESGPHPNAITPAGYEIVAAGIEGLASPYLVIGDDTAAGFTITEVFRKDVSYVARDGNVIRFRTVMLPSEANGDHQKAAIFYGASGTAGTGTMFNLLKQPFSKSSNAVLTVEARVTVGG